MPKPMQVLFKESLQYLQQVVVETTYPDSRIASSRKQFDLHTVAQLSNQLESMSADDYYTVTRRIGELFNTFQKSLEISSDHSRYQLKGFDGDITSEAVIVYISERFNASGKQLSESDAYDCEHMAQYFQVTSNNQIEGLFPILFSPIQSLLTELVGLSKELKLSQQPLLSSILAQYALFSYHFMKLSEFQQLDQVQGIASLEMNNPHIMNTASVDFYIVQHFLELNPLSSILLTLLTPFQHQVIIKVIELSSVILLNDSKKAFLCQAIFSKCNPIMQKNSESSFYREITKTMIHFFTEQGLYDYSFHLLVYLKEEEQSPLLNMIIQQLNIAVSLNTQAAKKIFDQILKKRLFQPVKGEFSFNVELLVEIVFYFYKSHLTRHSLASEKFFDQECWWSPLLSKSSLSKSSLLSRYILSKINQDTTSWEEEIIQHWKEGNPSVLIHMTENLMFLKHYVGSNYFPFNGMVDSLMKMKTLLIDQSESKESSISFQKCLVHYHLDKLTFDKVTMEGLNRLIFLSQESSESLEKSCYPYVLQNFRTSLMEYVGTNASEAHDDRLLSLMIQAGIYLSNRSKSKYLEGEIVEFMKMMYDFSHECMTRLLDSGSKGDDLIRRVVSQFSLFKLNQVRDLYLSLVKGGEKERKSSSFLDYLCFLQEKKSWVSNLGDAADDYSFHDYLVYLKEMKRCHEKLKSDADQYNFLDYITFLKEKELCATQLEIVPDSFHFDDYLIFKRSQ